MRRSESLFLLALGAFLVGVCLIGLLHYDYSATLMRFPLLAAGVTLLLVAVQLGLLWSGRGGAAAPEPSDAEVSDAAARPASSRRRAVTDAIWIFSVVPLVFLLGYPVGLAVYLLCVLRYFRISWTTSLGLAGASLALSYGLFVKTLGVSLPVLPVWWG